MSKPIGLQLYSMRGVLDQDLEGTLKKVGEMGYTTVEGYGALRWSAERLNAALKAAGLTVCSWHTGWELLAPDRLYSTIAYFKAIGNTSIVVPGMPHEYVCSIEAWKETAKKFSELAKILAEHGMTLGYHNHMFEFIPMDGEIPCDAFLAEACKCVNWQFDIGNAAHSKNADPVAYLNKYADRARYIHCKPYSFETGFDAIIGKDDMDWAAITAFGESNPTTVAYIVEYEMEATAEEGCKGCYDGLASFLK